MKGPLLHELGILVLAHQNQKDIFNDDIELDKQMYHETVRAFNTIMQYYIHYRDNINEDYE
jgi:hypothetical protein